MKKDCAGCRAWEHGAVCGLGYKLKPKYFNNHPIGGVPLEPCPKPKTYKELFVAPKKNKFKGVIRNE